MQALWKLWCLLLLCRTCSFRNTHIEAIMGHIWWNCNIVVPHGFVDVLIMFDQDPLWPHVLLCPSAQRDSRVRPGPDSNGPKAQQCTMSSTYMCWRTLEQSEGSTFCQQPRWAAALWSRSQYRGGNKCLMRMTDVLTDTRMNSSQDQRLSTYCVLWRKMYRWKNIETPRSISKAY